MINSRNGGIKIDNGTVSGYQQLENNTRIYLYMKPDITPLQEGILENKQINSFIKVKEMMHVPYSTSLKELRPLIYIMVFLL